MKIKLHAVFLMSLLFGATSTLSYEAPVFPFASAAGETGTTAVPVDDPSITSWATAVVSVNYGEEVAEEWRIPGNALGPGGGSQSHLLVLGRGGEVVLEFSSLIEDGPNADFVVFENAFRDTFLELAFVEVSSDGEHFVRFPAYSLTAEPVPAFGVVFPTFVHGLAGKYRTGFGTPFDLDTLRRAYAAAQSGEGGFSEAFRNHLLQNYPHVDLGSIRFVRLLDIPGDGSVFDCEGFPVYDPYPTVITAGFDLDAVGVIHAVNAQKTSFSDWCSANEVPEVWEEDSDHDTWSNAMEYLLGSDPSTHRSRPAMEVRILSGSADLVVAFDLNPVATSRPIAEVSPDGKTWQVVEVSRASEVWPDPELQPEPAWAVRVSVSPQEPVFFRLKAAQ